MLACCSATGATVAESASSASKNSPKPVLGATRSARAGSLLSASMRRATKALLSCGPRPARPLPKPARLRWIALRVFSSNMSKNWSMSTGSGRAALTGIVSPAAKPSFESPGTICRYLRPSGDLGRMIIVEFTGSGSTFLSRLRLEFGGDLAVAGLHRHHRLDHADAGAADPHLVALDQGVGVGHAGVEVVGGDEGQAVVGVVGEEDGDDDDQHGHRADDHRAACHSLYAAAVSHGPRR